MVLDIHGGKDLRAGGTIRRITSPGEILLLDASGNMTVRSEIDDREQFDDINRSRRAPQKKPAPEEGQRYAKRKVPKGRSNSARRQAVSGRRGLAVLPASILAGVGSIILHAARRTRIVVGALELFRQVALTQFTGPIFIPLSSLNQFWRTSLYSPRSPDFFAVFTESGSSGHVENAVGRTTQNYAVNFEARPAFPVRSLANRKAPSEDAWANASLKRRIVLNTSKSLWHFVAFALWSLAPTSVRAAVHDGVSLLVTADAVAQFGKSQNASEREQAEKLMAAGSRRALKRATWKQAESLIVTIEEDEPTVRRVPLRRYAAQAACRPESRPAPACKNPQRPSQQFTPEMPKAPAPTVRLPRQTATPRVPTEVLDPRRSAARSGEQRNEAAADARWPPRTTPAAESVCRDAACPSAASASGRRRQPPQSDYHLLYGSPRLGRRRRAPAAAAVEEARKLGVSLRLSRRQPRQGRGRDSQVSAGERGHRRASRTRPPGVRWPTC